ncbi:4-carboxymuconolactone decarboxylase [Microlunatus elymi]|uniref:4-carboxymuconolactone decarboxylase n=1 Tax=Microlunatus elymi TaxID=2596828 RepID=A0A516PZE1_9ACTN|nr:4-carboxymuconolactone decarboxylase [Microlunatus elymi]QDP96517.1 4-carboxymuconolactone decarboxylase [Microlunatus elymi]
MSTPRISGRMYGNPDLPPLVLGPSLGTTADSLWRPVIDLVWGEFSIFAFDLPGHGLSDPAAGSFTMAELADSVLDAVRSSPIGERRFRYAGVSIGGAIGLQLLLDHPDRLRPMPVLLCTGAKIGEPEDWQQRADEVRRSGSASWLDRSLQRWFAPGFASSRPGRATALGRALSDADDESYAKLCEVLAVFDVRDRLAEIELPLIAVSGDHDVAAPPAVVEQLATGVRQGVHIRLDDVGHLAPVEAPDLVARILAGGPPADRFERGLATRRAVLGDDHVDRAEHGVTTFTADFQKLITDYAWDGIWNRPGLDRRARSMITITALVALGHHDELAMHVKAARRNGLSADEISEVLLQSAIYCGVPAANTAYKIAGRALAEFDLIAGAQERDQEEQTSTP